MKYLLISLIAAFTLILGCSNDNKNTKANSKSSNDIVEVKSDAYKLMKQYCYICHMPQSKETMIAPPLFRVKEHYQPVYKTKAEFVDAVVKWVKNPKEEDALMPGAVRKFECMPAQSHIPKDTVKLIAAYIFDNEMETPGFHRRMHNKDQANSGGMNRRNRQGNGGRNTNLQLNDGKKWKVAPNVLSTMDDVKKILHDFNGNSIEDYQKFGQDIFKSSKRILLNKENKGEVWDQLHTFFNKIEEDMHSLMAVESLDEGQRLLNKIKNKVKVFDDYFE